MKELEEYFEKFTVTQGKIYDYLGMKIELKSDKKVAIDMSKQILDIINDFSKEISGRVTSPATKDLYDVRKFTKRITHNQKDEFHSVA